MMVMIKSVRNTVKDEGAVHLKPCWDKLILFSHLENSLVASYVSEHTVAVGPR